MREGLKSSQTSFYKEGLKSSQTSFLEVLRLSDPYLRSVILSVLYTNLTYLSQEHVVSQLSAVPGSQPQRHGGQLFPL